MKLLKVELDNIEELKKVGRLVFEKPMDVKVTSDMELEGGEECENYYDIFHITNEVLDGILIDFLEIELVHKQYDFQEEKLYGFYEITSCSGGENNSDLWKRFEKFTETYNKKEVL